MMHFVDVSIHGNVDLFPCLDNSECGDIGGKVEKPLEKLAKVSHWPSEVWEMLLLAEVLEKYQKDASMLRLLNANTEEK